MCGIAALYSKFSEEECKTFVEQAINSYAYRGPDDRDITFTPAKKENQSDFNVCLGHLRLSIIDLSSAGHQPMFDASGRYSLIFNGEIYNYKEIKSELESQGVKFKTQTDTEVFLELYAREGEKMMTKLNGMFAFVIHDLETGELFFARDHFGIKPLYYVRNEKGTFFVSEPKALIYNGFVEFKPNDKMVFDLLAFGSRDHIDETMFEDIYQVPPAHWGKLTTENKFTLKRYWQLPNLKDSKRKSIDSDETVEELRNLLTNAIKLQLQSDVPIGTNLSGGIDSSGVATIGSSLQSSKFSSFTGTFPGEKEDESNFAKIVVDHAKLNATYIFPVDNKVNEDLEHFMEIHGEPVRSLSQYLQFFVFNGVKENNVKVILDGQGADELFLGYIHFIDKYYRYLGGKFRWLKLRKIMKAHAKFTENKFSNLIWLKKLFIGLVLYNTPNFIRKRRARMQIHYMKDKVVEDFLDVARVGFALKTDMKGHLNRQLTEITLPQLLSYEDRSAMAFSIEARVPYLDYRLVEEVYKLPSKDFLDRGITKYPLRKILENIIPDEITWRKDKKGFSAPEQRWVLLLKDQILNLLNSEAWISKFVSLEFVYETLNKDKEDFDLLDAQFIWRCYNTEWWYQYFSKKPKIPIKEFDNQIKVHN